MKRHAAPILAALLLLLLLYPASYLAMVTPGAQVNTVNPLDLEMRNYRVGGDLVEKIYFPLELVDRRLFPNRWRGTYRKSRLFNPLPD